MKIRKGWGHILLLGVFLVTGCLSEREAYSSITGIRSDSLAHDCLTRTYTLYVPSSYDPDREHPLVFLLHGGGGTGEGMRALTRGGFETLADREGFILVYPDAYDNHWNDGRNLVQYHSQKENVDDVGFITSLIDNLSNQYSIDKRRVYAAGISNGGMMAQRLACEATDAFAGIAVVASAMSENLYSTCYPSHPIPVLLISGTEDPLVPFKGGEVELFGKKYGAVLSVEETREFWAKNNGCSPTPETSMESDVDPSDGTRVGREVNAGCRMNADVALYAVEGGGHAWPRGLRYLPERIIGKTSEDVDANSVVWEFFKGHSQDESTRTPISRSAVENVTILQPEGGRASWLHSENLIAFDRAGEGGYFDVYVIRPGGEDLRCLTCDAPAVPQLHNGNPSWHPSGRYLIFQAQDPALTLSLGAMGSYLSSPGIGINNNLWVTDADGSLFWQLTHVQENHGILHPHFSPDGKKLLWSEVADPRGSMGGHWVMRLADFSVEEGRPRLSNMETLRPLNLQLYETHGFSPDGTKILFSGVEEGEYYYGMEIYVMDLIAGETSRLTNNDEWDEHAHFTPDGKSIVWTSSESTPQEKGASWEEVRMNPPMLEYWMMEADGAKKRQLSWFNNPGAEEFMDFEGGAGLGDFDFGPDGKTIVGKLRRGRGSEMLVLVAFAFEDGVTAV